MPKQTQSGLRVTRCSNMEGYMNKKSSELPRLEQELRQREWALCNIVENWIKNDREKIVNLILSPQGMARGYLDVWVRYGDKQKMPMMPDTYTDDADRERKLKANFRAIVDHAVANKGVNQLKTLKGDIYVTRIRDRKKEFVPLETPNGEVDRVMRIWDEAKAGYLVQIPNGEGNYNGIAMYGLQYVHPNELPPAPAQAQA